MKYLKIYETQSSILEYFNILKDLDAYYGVTGFGANDDNDVVSYYIKVIRKKNSSIIQCKFVLVSSAVDKKKIKSINRMLEYFDNLDPSIQYFYTGSPKFMLLVHIPEANFEKIKDDMIKHKNTQKFDL